MSKPDVRKGMDDEPYVAVGGKFFARGKDLLSRNDDLHRWISRSISEGLWPYQLEALTCPTDTRLTVRALDGQTYEGLNFFSVDYLGLAGHPRLKCAAMQALEEFGPHSVSSGALMGNSPLSRGLVERLRSVLGLDNVLLFPNGWSAGFGAIAGLVRAFDYVLLDELAHQCLQQGAGAATKHLSRFRHLDHEAARIHLTRIRKEAPEAAILVVTEGLYSMDGDIPDLGKLLEICREYEASLLVDVSHDLGCFGSGPGGSVEAQQLLGQVDLVVGAFSKVFGALGGFVASNSASAIRAISLFGGSYTYATAFSPLQVALISEALEIACSEEGDRLRRDLGLLSEAARAHCEKLGLVSYGDQASPILPILVGDERGTWQSGRAAMAAGVLAPTLVFPVVPRGTGRFRLSLRADHKLEDVKQALDLLAPLCPIRSGVR